MGADQERRLVARRRDRVRQRLAAAAVEFRQALPVPRRLGRLRASATARRRPSGAALANRKHGRLSVDIQGDGDLMYAPGVLWTAAHHQIPLLRSCTTTAPIIRK